MFDESKIMKEILEVYKILGINISELEHKNMFLEKYTKYNYEEKSSLSGNSYANM